MSNENSNELGDVIDRLYALREQRLGLDKRVKEMKEEEVAIRNKIFEMLGSQGLRRASGAVATAGITVATIPLVEDWDKVWAYIKAHDATDLVQKRVSVTAWRARHEEGVVIDGISAVENVDISLTRASRG